MGELPSNREWKKWGEIDPLFSVASWHGKNKNGSDPWTDEDFYKLGESDCTDFREHWEMYGVNAGSCLEIGCGAGRITLQLASYFNEVHALDVSEKMIEYAQNRIASPSVFFHLSKGIEIPLEDQSVHAVFSTHVFQHLDSLSVARSYFSEIGRVLTSGGTLMIHLPIYKWPAMSTSFDLLYSVLERMADIRSRIKRLLMDLGMAKPMMRRLSYPVEFFYEEFPKLGFGDIELSIFVTKSNNSLHPFILARKGTSREDPSL